MKTQAQQVSARRFLNRCGAWPIQWSHCAVVHRDGVTAIAKVPAGFAVAVDGDQQSQRGDMSVCEPRWSLKLEVCGAAALVYPQTWGSEYGGDR